MNPAITGSDTKFMNTPTRRMPISSCRMPTKAARANVHFKYSSDISSTGTPPLAVWGTALWICLTTHKGREGPVVGEGSVPLQGPQDHQDSTTPTPPWCALVGTRDVVKPWWGGGGGRAKQLVHHTRHLTRMDMTAVGPEMRCGDVPKMKSVRVRDIHTPVSHTHENPQSSPYTGLPSPVLLLGAHCCPPAL